MASIFNVIACKILSIFIKRDKNIWIFLCINSDAFFQNTKYFYLYLNQNKIKNPEVKPIWLSSDKNLIKTLRQKGYLAYYNYSLAAFYYRLKAKYYFTDIPLFLGLKIKWLSIGATSIDFFHGLSFKKVQIFIRNKTTTYEKMNTVERFLYNQLVAKNSYFTACGDYDSEIYHKTYKYFSEHIVQTGSPHIDSLFNNIENIDIMMEKDIEYISKIKNSGHKLILYAPTFRDTGKDISGWLKYEKLQSFLRKNNIRLICKLHYADRNNIDTGGHSKPDSNQKSRVGSLSHQQKAGNALNAPLCNITESDVIYKMEKNADLYAVLKYFDALITDYSSIFLDYLLLDKPIIFYPFDLKEYLEQCREFYTPYERMSPGIKVYNEEEMIEAIEKIIERKDDYKDERKRVRDLFFKHTDGENCKRIAEFVKGLDK